MIENVVVIVIDALRADKVRSNDDRNLTPHLDELADNSFFFTQAYSTTNTTDPAVTSLQTGRHPLSHGIHNHGTHVTNEEKAAIETVESAPEIFRQNGFLTSKIGRPLGRWHKQGFDEYPEVSSTHWHRRAFEKKMSKLLYDTHPRIGDIVSRFYNSVFSSEGTDCKDPDDAVEDIIEVLGNDEYVYSFVHWMDTHTPYTAPEELIEDCLERYEYDEDRHLETIAAEFPNESITANSLRSGGVIYEGSEQWVEKGHDLDTQLINARYDAAVRYADAKVGALVSKLQESGLYDRTMIVALSDHGESLGEHGIYYEHHGLYECTVRIPLLMHVPGCKSKEIDELVSIMDILPTICDYTEVTPSSEVNGQSLRPIIEDDEEIDRTSILLEEDNAQRRRAIVTDNWKYIRALDDGVCRYCDCQHSDLEELYNLGKDTEEKQNVIEEYPHLASDLACQMEEQVEKLSEDTPKSDDTVTYDDEEEMMDRLEALGYR